jgi:hypothetical protein
MNRYEGSSASREAMRREESLRRGREAEGLIDDLVARISTHPAAPTDADTLSRFRTGTRKSSVLEFTIGGYEYSASHIIIAKRKNGQDHGYMERLHVLRKATDLPFDVLPDISSTQISYSYTQGPDLSKQYIDDAHIVVKKSGELVRPPEKTHADYLRETFPELY